jgi:hypothetical protein
LNAGEQVGQNCKNFGTKDDEAAWGDQPGFDADASCEPHRQECLSADPNFRASVRSRCPLMCHDECARDVVERGGLPIAQQTFPAEPCGCTQAALLDCGDFYEINAACPVHRVGSLVPASCDGRYSQQHLHWSRLLDLNLLTDRLVLCFGGSRSRQDGR